MMEILMDVETVQGKTLVTVLRPHGRIDGSNYESLIARVSQLYASGSRNLLLDMGDVNFVSSAGLVALHSIVLLMRGEKPSDPQSGWDALHAIERDAITGAQPYVKLLNPQPKISKTLEMAGMDRFFEVFTDEGAAIASF
jgi:anti-anti-sigma regulatory factor